MELAGADLRAWLAIGLARGAGLLTAGERLVVGRLLDLDDGLLGVYARLWARVGPCWREGELAAEARAALLDGGLLDPWVTEAERLAVMTVPELAVACKERGLPGGGRREQLVERLVGRLGLLGRGWVRLRHAGLVTRLARWATLRRRPDPSEAVIERLGHARWRAYPLTSGPTLHRDRRALLAWEQAAAALSAMAPDDALAALREGRGLAAGRLDLRRRLVERVVEAAWSAEREGSPELGLAWLDGLVSVGAATAAAVAVRAARCEERLGQPERALQRLADARGAATPTDRLAIGRAGGRLARSLRRGWAPDPPLRAPPVRDLRLIAGEGGGARPSWLGPDGEPSPIEAAVAAHLRGLGRAVIRAEQAPWRALLALLFDEALWLPVPGALPAPRLSAPLDLFQPGFRARRAEQVEAILGALRAGQGPARLRAAWPEVSGTRALGVDWERASVDALAAFAEGLGGSALAGVLGDLLEGGREALAGLPDLVLLPGPEARLEAAFPSRVPEGALLIEVKGPTDAVRDAQAVWFDRLIGWGVPVEVWSVSAAGGAPGAGRAPSRRARSR